MGVRSRLSGLGNEGKVTTGTIGLSHGRFNRLKVDLTEVFLLPNVFPIFLIGVKVGYPSVICYSKAKLTCKGVVLTFN